MKKKSTKVKATIKNMPRRQSLFWDVDPKTIDPKKHARYVIERILDFGNDNEVRWMAQSYSRMKIRNTVERSRALRPQTKASWRLLTQK